jgi:hypothetical protein
MADGYTIRNVDDFEVMEGSGGATWRLARDPGSRGLGFTVVDIEPGVDPAHDHSGDDRRRLRHPRRAGTIVAGEEDMTPQPAPSAACPEVHDDPHKSDAPVRAL